MLEKNMPLYEPDLFSAWFNKGDGVRTEGLGVFIRFCVISIEDVDIMQGSINVNIATSRMDTCR
jgi:hypothetical protein